MKITFWDILTIAILITTAVVIVVVVGIFTNPDSQINPFPNPTLPPTIMVPTSTATLVSLPPTWTPTPRIDATPRPTSTMIPTATDFVIPPTP
ncbi:MAG: hypothetical protein NTZ74_13180 [Chloroflexi bacterium]|nr:hypothetical protein [Chloroflexota bacterium]